MRFPLRRGCLVAALAQLASGWAAGAEPLDVELSGEVDRFADVQFRIGGGGRQVTFQTGSDVLSIPIEGGDAETLTPPATENPELVEISPALDRVLLAANEPGSLAWLFSAPLAGGEAVRLHPPLAADVRAFPGPITPDGGRVVYGTGTFGSVEVFVAPLAGGASIPLTLPDRPLDARADLLELFAISPDGTLGVAALFERLDEDETNDPDPVALFSTPLEGGPPTVLHEGMWFNEPFVFTPDAQHVVYDRAGELFSTSVAGGTPALLSADRTGPGIPVDFSITPGGERVIYEQNLERGFQDIYSVPTLGGDSTRLSHPEGTAEAFPWVMAPDGGRVVFAQYLGLFPALERQLFSVPVAGGEPTPLSPPVPISIEFLGIRGIRVSPDSDRVLYAAEQDAADQTVVYAVPIEGGPITRLAGPIARNGTFSTSEIIARFHITPDGTRVVFLLDATDDDFDGPFELYAVPIEGGVSTKLSAPLAAGQRISEFSLQLTPDGRHAVFIVTQPGRGPVELHSARLPPDVRIDVQPRKAHNVLPRGRRASIAVAILGSADLDVTKVEVATLAFGPDGAAPERKPRRIDVDGDGFRDLVTRYRREETGLSPGDDEACLAGRYDGFEFLSCDGIATR
jgi:hypothetical protein